MIHLRNHTSPLTLLPLYIVLVRQVLLPLCSDSKHLLFIALQIDKGGVLVEQITTEVKKMSSHQCLTEYSDGVSSVFFFCQPSTGSYPVHRSTATRDLTNASRAGCDVRCFTSPRERTQPDAISTSCNKLRHSTPRSSRENCTI